MFSCLCVWETAGDVCTSICFWVTPSLSRPAREGREGGRERGGRRPRGEAERRKRTQDQPTNHFHTVRSEVSKGSRSDEQRRWHFTCCCFLPLVQLLGELGTHRTLPRPLALVHRFRGERRVHTTAPGHCSVPGHCQSQVQVRLLHWESPGHRLFSLPSQWFPFERNHTTNH